MLQCCLLIAPKPGFAIELFCLCLIACAAIHEKEPKSLLIITGISAGSTSGKSCLAGMARWFWWTHPSLELLWRRWQTGWSPF